MISIGLAGWGDHDEIYTAGVKAQDKLRAYNNYFSVVEVDSSYYAIHKDSLFQKWVSDTSANFSFVIKAFQGMTGHTRQAYSEAETEGMFHSFKESIKPALAAGKVKAVLFQYPPWFECNRENVALLRAARERMDGIPAALEFRHQSWFSPEMSEKTVSFMRGEGWIHSICDEPQVFPGSVPTVLKPTNERLTIVRFHGRNVSGWTSNGERERDWREVRYLYRYSEEELLEWKENLLALERETEEVCVIFNNNSGGDAAANALQLMELLGIERKDFPPEQMDMFE